MADVHAGTLDLRNFHKSDAAYSESRVIADEDGKVCTQNTGAIRSSAWPYRAGQIYRGKLPHSELAQNHGVIVGRGIEVPL